MKTAKIIKLFILLFVVLFIAYGLYFNPPFCSSSTRINEGKILTKTHWMGEGAYAKFTPEPNSNTLGCWSTTIAQIAYFYKLQPCGISDYQCGKGYKIHENLGNYKFDWNKFANEINDLTAQGTIDETARYCYYIATIVQKDFGTGRYITKLPPIKNIENQLKLNAKEYINYKGIFHSKNKIKNIVIKEIEANRPLYMYYRNINVRGSGHSVVLDGYKFDNRKFYVHLNFGWGGRNDGWFDPFQAIATEGDTQLRIFITFSPQKEKTGN